MRSTKLEMMWIFIFDLAQNLMKKNPEYDGRLLWKSIAESLPNGQAIRWILDEKIKTHLFSFVTKVENELDNPNEINIHHFIRQHARLTYKAPTIKHILQIAFSSGNLIGSGNELISIIDYNHYKLSSIFTYISREDVEMLSLLM